MHNDVVVCSARTLRSDTDQLSGHAQMKYPNPALVESNENVFAFAPNRDNSPADDLRQGAFVNARAQPRLDDFNVSDFSSHDMRAQTAANGFDLGQLRHCLALRFEAAANGVVPAPARD